MCNYIASTQNKKNNGLSVSIVCVCERERDGERKKERAGERGRKQYLTTALRWFWAFSERDRWFSLSLSLSSHHETTNSSLFLSLSYIGIILWKGVLISYPLLSLSLSLSLRVLSLFFLSVWLDSSGQRQNGDGLFHQPVIFGNFGFRFSVSVFGCSRVTQDRKLFGVKT